MRNQVTVRVPGTCGELMQGLIDGTNLQISCPVALYSSVTLTRVASSSGIQINSRAEKTRLAIAQTLEVFNASDLGLQVYLQSELIPGKGMASSTADIIASIIATMLLLGVEVDRELAQKIAISIEPTDGCFLSGLVAFDHLQGRYLEKLGTINPVPIIIFDTGGQVDTVEFNARDELTSLKLAQEEQVTRAYQLISQAIKTRDKKLLGQGVSISSQANQSILYKPELEKLLELAQQQEEILGVNTAHSGTLLGVLLDSKDRVEEIKTKISRRVPSLDCIATTKLINGGYQVRS